jgi:hypothetical protein
MGDLGLIQRDNHDENADTETCNGPATVKISDVLSGSLQGTTKTEDQRAQNDGPAATKAIGSDACHCRTEEGTSRENGHDSTATGEAWSAGVDEQGGRAWIWFPSTYISFADG